jgi:hypothetical protein
MAEDFSASQTHLNANDLSVPQCKIFPLKSNKL